MMPMSFLEMMNAAVPIIGPPHAGMLDLVLDEETGIILKSWDVGAFSAAIEWALAHPQWRVLAGQAAHAHLVANFDIESIADQYVGLYLRLIGLNRPKKFSRGTKVRMSLPRPEEESI
jgi:glycosyltransferase involved in cell wall biosynthesis